MELDLHRLDLRFAAMRITDAPAVQRLADSIEEHGQLVECVAVGQPGDLSLVLIDGYRRVAALARLGRDIAAVQCWSCSVSQALTQALARSGSRPFIPIEEAMLLRELIDTHGLTQREAAHQCARDVSWVQRRLMLLGGLTQDLLQAVRQARVSSWAATRVFVPLARANSEHASRLLASLQEQGLSTRELCTWFEHYQGAPHAQRERMVAHPRLFMDSLNERERERDAKRLREGPEREVMGELGHLGALLERVRRRLEPLSTPVPLSLARACGRVHAALPEVASELRRLCNDSDRDPQQRAHIAAAGPQPARDQQAVGAVAQHRAAHPAPARDDGRAGGCTGRADAAAAQTRL
jgi:ParB family transcriptional regulator, chromosome partitioning protein